MYKQNKICSRTLKIIELLANQNGGFSISEISRSLDIPKSTTHDLIHTLLHHGFLEYENERLKTFKLGIKLFEIGSSVIGKSDIQKEARLVLEKVKNECEGTVFLVMEDKGEIVYLDKLESDDTMITTAHLGSRREMYCTGVGKAILSTYEDSEVIKWAEGRSFEKKTESTITSVEELLVSLKEAREQGYAIDRGEDAQHLLCVAAPIYGPDKKAKAAISIATFDFKVTEDKFREHKKIIVQAANEITRRIGGTK